MSDFQGRAKEFTRLIDELSLKIMEKIGADQLGDVSELITKRLDYLTELVSLVVTEQDKQWLLKYLDQFQKIDQTIIQAVNQERDLVKNTILNIKKIREYTSNV